MTALPTKTTGGALAALPALSPAAQRASATDPRLVLERWYAGLGAGARLRYRRSLRAFASWATGDSNPSGDVALRVLVGAGRAGARGMVVAWRDELLEAGKATGTVASAVHALASCVTAARLAGLIEWHLEKVAPRVEPREDRSGPPRHEVELLLSRLDEEIAENGRRVRYAIRDAAIIRMLYVCAFRRSEVVGLRIEDVQLDHPDGPRVLALRKGHRERQAMLVSTNTAGSLRRWLEVRGTSRPAAPVFCRLHAQRDLEAGTRLTGEAVRLMLRARAKQTGVRATVRPHGLRHSAATHCARNASLAALKQLGGWVSLSAPARYLDRDDRDRRAALAVVEC